MLLNNYFGSWPATGSACQQRQSEKAPALRFSQQPSTATGVTPFAHHHCRPLPQHLSAMSKQWNSHSGPQKLTDFYLPARDQLYQHGGGSLSPHKAHRLPAVGRHTAASLQSTGAFISGQTNGESSSPDSPTTRSPAKLKKSR